VIAYIARHRKTNNLPLMTLMGLVKSRSVESLEMLLSPLTFLGQQEYARFAKSGRKAKATLTGDVGDSAVFRWREEPMAR
jgi:hypothetical protein